MDENSWGEQEFRLSGTVDQVARARGLVSGALGREHPLHDDCVLLTSELATNAVMHSRSGSGGAFTITVSCSGDVVRVCVRDEGSAQPPCCCRPNAYASGGRGLPLIEALARRWGLIREAGANSVWFELAFDLVGASRAHPSGELVNC
jgi:anti-sigma regulatory factor (Ser/Thr protein kinase)